MEPIKSLQINMSNSDENYMLLTNLALAVIVIVGFVIIMYIITKFSNNDLEFVDSDTSVDNTNTVSTVTTTHTCLPCLQLPQQECPIIENNAGEWKMDKVKTIYKQGEPIYYPASLGSDGYMSRDYICYKDKANDINYISKRPGCMACLVDAEDKIDPVTKTNIKAVCLHGPDLIINNKLWNENTCITECGALANPSSTSTTSTSTA